MKLLILMAQRKCGYEGEYAPEALAVMTEYGHSKNPDCLHSEYRKAKASGEFTTAEIVIIDVSDDAIEMILSPVTETETSTVN